MPKNNIEDLRNLLFQALEDLVTPEKEITELDINKSKAICGIAQTILAVGKFEVRYKRQVDMNDEVRIDFAESKKIKLPPR